MLLVSFETELMKLALSASFAEIEERFQILFVPTWQPFFTAAVLLVAARASQDFFVMPSGLWESDLCRQLSPRCHALPFHAASWVNEGLYQKARKKDVDILVVANFMRYKRHWKIFEAVAEMPRGLAICVAGVPIGERTRDTIWREARAFGVEDRVGIYDTLSDAALADLVSRAKIMCAMSHREGSYVAVAEALMAGVPVGMYANAMIGTSAYINEETGVFFCPKTRLSRQIMEFLGRSTQFCPDRWARANISATKNWERLNALLRQHAMSRGERWTKDIEKFCAVRFEFHYCDAVEATFTDAYEELQRSFGVSIERPYRDLPIARAASKSTAG